MNRLLRITLTMTGIVLVLTGVLYLMVPTMVESLLKVSLSDQATAMVYGVTNLAVAFLCLSAAIRGKISKGEYRFLLVYAILIHVIFSLLIPFGIYSLPQALPQTIIWLVLVNLLIIGGRSDSLLTFA